MPIYVYQEILPDGSLGEEYEIMQKLSDEPLQVHPKTGQPIKKIIKAPGLTLKHSSQAKKKLLSNENIAAKGFTKYERAGDGEYIKTAGDGPSYISRDEVGQ